MNGYVSAGERSSYWYDFAVIAVGHSTIIGDAANWPAMRGRSLSGYQRKRVWLNDGARPLHRGGAGRRRHATPTTAARWRSPISATAACSTSSWPIRRGPLLVYRNTVAPGRHWIQFELEGSASNRSAIGARVELHWSGARQVQEVAAASGFSAQNQRRLHYGLGDGDAGRSRRHSLAVGTRADDRAAGHRHAASREGTRDWLRASPMAV